MAKVYQVIFQDEYNNLYQVGFYKNLEDSVKDVNDMLSTYKTQSGEVAKIDKINEYTSTFGTAIDTDVFVEDGCVMVRGFIFDTDTLKEAINGG